MFPNLSYISNYFFNTPVDNSLSVVQTFGLFLIITFITGFYVFKRELKWREANGIIKGVKNLGLTQNDIPNYIIVVNFIVGLILGSKIPLIIDSGPNESIKDILFSFQGNFLGGIIGAIILGGAGIYIKLNQKEERQKESTSLLYPSDYAIELTIIAAITGIIGSKVFSVLENLPAFFASPIKTLFSGSGLTIYGGLITAFVAGYFYMKKKGFKVLPIMDALGPTLLVGYMIGRMGCHFSGDGDWGKVNVLTKPNWLIIPDWLWSWRYPHNVVNSSIESIPIENCGGLISATGNPPIYCKILPEGVFPTPLYEIIMCGIILLFILYIRKKSTIPGYVFFIYLALSGLERFIIEFMRVNVRYGLLGLDWSFSQWIALLMIIIGVIGIYFLRKTSKVKV